MTVQVINVQRGCGVCVGSVCKPLGEELVYPVRRRDLLLGVAAQVGWEAAVRGGGVVAQRKPWNNAWENPTQSPQSESDRPAALNDTIGSHETNVYNCPNSLSMCKFWLKPFAK